MTQQDNDVLVDVGETVNLTAGSSRFRGAIKLVTPKTIAEVRHILGPSVRQDEAKGSKGHFCCTIPELSSVLLTKEELDSEDKEVRFRARNLAYIASREYVRSTNPESFAHWESVLDHFIDISKTAFNILTVKDITVQNRGTLIIGRDIYGVTAKTIRLYGSGKIVCNGPTTLRAESFEGKIMTLNPGVFHKNLVE